MKNILVIAAVVLAACTVRQTDGGIDVDPATDRIGDWSAELQSQGNSPVLGSVAARSALTNTGVSITIGRANSGDRHPWHIHSGTCGSGGAIVGDPTKYPLLQVGQNGNASASAHIDVGLSEDRSYHINVHRSSSQMGTIIACGNLRD